MCGIAGIYDHRGSGRADPKLVDAMVDAMRHRGPDGSGRYRWPEASPQIALGLRRLSVIDLQTGHQPMFNEAKTIATVCNGEIYNHVELREQLERNGHRFRSRSDVEVLVHLYEEHELDLFQHLRGMYAFALWDAHRERLLLAVDPIGIKPLYLTESDGSLAFASEIKALFADNSLQRRLNLNALDTYLSFGYMIGTETLFTDIRRLPPGHVLLLEGGQCKQIQYRDLKASASDEFTDEQEAVSAIRRTLVDSVRLHMRSDVPLGLFLSGGIDSAAILALMARQRSQPVRTFTVGFEGHGTQADDESRHAARIAAHFGARHRELRLTADDWWVALNEYVHVHEEPNANPSAVTLLPLAHLASKDVKVVLTGLGGDEVFCGYPFHFQLPKDLRTSERLQRWLPEGIARFVHHRFQPRLESLYPAFRRVRGVSGALHWLIERQRVLMPPEGVLRRALSYNGLVATERLREALYGSDLAAARRGQYKERSFAALIEAAASEEPADLVQRLIIQTWLPGNGLLSLDKVTMAHSLEARVPYFDPPLFSTALQCSPSIRLKRNKNLLRQAVRNDLPETYLRRPKRPFSTPIRSWFDHELAGRIQAILLDRRSLERGWFKPQALEKLVRGHFAGKTDHTEMIFRLLLLELWQRSEIDQASPGEFTA